MTMQTDFFFFAARLYLQGNTASIRALVSVVVAPHHVAFAFWDSGSDAVHDDNNRETLFRTLHVNPSSIQAA